jgi:hypothetical protein
VTDQEHIHEQGFTIVVVGRMNPAIHQPAWYRFIDAISEEEQQQTIKNGVVILPNQAHFGFEGLQISCDFERWQVALEGELSKSIERGKAIASKVFDISLKHTPVTSVAFTFNNHVSVPGVSTVAPRIPQLVAPVVGLERFEGLAGRASLLTQTQDGQYTIQIEPSVVNPALLYVGFFFESRLPAHSPAEPMSEIRIDDLIDKTVPKLMPRMTSELAAIRAAVEGRR